MLVKPFRQSINASPSVSAATSLSDFFCSNAATNYLSKITSLSGSAASQFASGPQFTRGRQARTAAAYS